MSTFLELRTELSDRGFNTLTPARLGSYINRARSRLDGMYCWPYREASATGVAPLSIPTLGIVEAVSNETLNYPLEPAGYADLTSDGCDLSLTGSPVCWYRTSPSGVPVIATYPTGTDTIGVQHWEVTPDLVLDAEEPQAPERFHMLIVDIATQMAERERGNYAAAAGFTEDVKEQVGQMVVELLTQQEPTLQRMTDASTDG
jgi:hypothetical protein